MRLSGRCSRVAGGVLCLGLTFGLVLSLSVHAQSMADLLAAQGQNATGTKPCRPPGVNLPPGVSLPASVCQALERYAGKPTGEAGPGGVGQVSQPGASNIAEGQRAGSAEVLAQPLNSFQNFILQSTGKRLPRFGEEFFRPASLAARQTLFMAGEMSPVSDNYLLGPGDEVLVRVFSAAFDLEAPFIIYREGFISLPKVGPVKLAGVPTKQLEPRLSKALSAVLADFNLYATTGRLKSVEVYVVGQAMRPGKLVVSSLSSLVNAVFESGGPNANGSYRGVELVRNNKVIASFDLYDFLAKGKTQSEVRLQTGDVINIPPVGRQVALTGAVPQPMVFELPSQLGSSANLGELVNLVGGLPIFTEQLEATIQRTTPSKDRPLSVQQVSLDKVGLMTPLRDGDVVYFKPLVPRFDNAVTLRILGEDPIQVPITPGARVSDVLPDRKTLLSAKFFYRQVQPLAQDASGSLTPGSLNVLVQQELLGASGQGGAATTAATTGTSGWPASAAALSRLCGCW